MSNYHKLNFYRDDDGGVVLNCEDFLTTGNDITLIINDSGAALLRQYDANGGVNYYVVDLHQALSNLITRLDEQAEMTDNEPI